MIRVINCVLVVFGILFTSGAAFGQNRSDTSKKKTVKEFLIIKNDGSEYVGEIISQDAREVLINTKKVGQIYIAKDQIQEIKAIAGDDKKDVTKAGDYIGDEAFATRYFITTNGLPIEKGDNYILWNLFGPDFEFGVVDNLSLGIMTTWIGAPLVGSFKYSIPLDKNTNLGLGLLAGTGSWAFPDFGFALPFAAFTYGDRRANLTLSGGYGRVWADGNSDGRFLCSVAGMVKAGKRFSVLFDSFILPPTSSSPGFALIIPGFRIQTHRDKSFQIGFVSIISGDNQVITLPMFQWFSKI